MKNLQQTAGAYKLQFSFKSWTALLFFLLFPGLLQIQKYLGNVGVFVYLVLGVMILLRAHRFWIPFFLARTSHREFKILAGLTFVILALILFSLYPLADSGIVGGGSDNDDGFNVACRACSKGIIRIAHELI